MHIRHLTRTAAAESSCSCNSRILVFRHSTMVSDLAVEMSSVLEEGKRQEVVHNRLAKTKSGIPLANVFFAAIFFALPVGLFGVARNLTR